MFDIEATLPANVFALLVPGLLVLPSPVVCKLTAGLPLTLTLPLPLPLPLLLLLLLLLLILLLLLVLLVLVLLLFIVVATSSSSGVIVEAAYIGFGL